MKKGSLIEKKVTIIGAGPSGISTGIQLKRYGIEPLVLEAKKVGGLLLNANLVENYPGFPDGIPGEELVALFKKQAEKNNLHVIHDEAIRLEYKHNSFFISTKNKRLIKSRIVVVASGTKPKVFADIKIPNTVKNKIFYEVTPLRKNTNKKIAVIGAGDSAFDYALNLAQKNNKVTILNRSTKTRCLPILFDRAMNNANIEYVDSVSLKRILKHKSEKVRIVYTRKGQDIEKNVDYILFAIGREPKTDYFSESFARIQNRLTEKGLLHFVGDVKNENFRQIAISVGDGVLTAMKIAKFLSEEKI